MKKIDLGQAITILANIGVLIGILLLAFELSQNRQMMQTQTRSTLTQLDVEQIRSLRLDNALMQQTVDRSPNLNSVEELRFSLWVRESARVAEHQFYQYRVGALNDSEFQGVRNLWKRVYADSTHREWWESNKSDFSADFQKELGALLAED